MNEKFYDEQIAPLLAEVGRLCESRGFSFVAGVEYEPGQIGSTRVWEEYPSLPIVMLWWSIVCNGNFDLFVMKLLSWQGDRPHNSAVLRLLQNHNREYT